MKPIQKTLSERAEYEAGYREGKIEGAVEAWKFEITESEKKSAQIQWFKLFLVVVSGAFSAHIIFNLIAMFV